jgi:type II secretory pathway pseudopilin PulG
MSARSRSLRGSRRSGRGYTAVEVMLAMTVLIISAAGVMSMQKGAVQGNLDARKLDVANSVARIWLDRLSTDATTWTSVGGAPAGSLSNTLVLGSLAPAIPGIGTFQPAPTIAAQGWSPAFDIFGRDVSTSSATMVFCTDIDIDNLAVDQNNQPMMLRATVLVFWGTALVGSTVQAYPGCPGPPNGTVTSQPKGTYHTLFATEALRRPS